MNKATENELGELHSRLARAMKQALEASDEAVRLLENIDPEEVPAEVLVFIKKHAAANPSLLTAIAKFLKDNDITCAPSDSEELSELEETLSKKRRRSVGNVVHIEDDNE